MKILLFTVSLFLFTGIKAQTSEEVVKDFFIALTAKDAETLDKLTLNDMNLHSLNLADNITLSSLTKTKFIESVKSIPEEVEIEERIFDISSLITDNLALFQVPYQFYVNEELSHSGTNVLTLLKTEEGWKISYIADTRNK